MLSAHLHVSALPAEGASVPSAHRVQQASSNERNVDFTSRTVYFEDVLTSQLQNHTHMCAPCVQQPAERDTICGGEPAAPQPPPWADFVEHQVQCQRCYDNTLCWPK